MNARDAQQERRSLLAMSAWVSGGTIALTALGAWATSTPLLPPSQGTGLAVLLGLVVALPLLALFFVLRSLSFEPVKRVYRIVNEYFGPAMLICRLDELAFVAIGAGVSEELLFRGLLPAWFASRGTLVALIAPNVLFGLLHAVSITYAILATCIGLFFSLCLLMCPETNLVTVMVAHAIYDFIAFVVVARDYRRQQTPK